MWNAKEISTIMITYTVDKHTYFQKKGLQLLIILLIS